jgi:hypothetical protein
MKFTRTNFWTEPSVKRDRDQHRRLAGLAKRLRDSRESRSAERFNRQDRRRPAIIR